MKHVFLSLLALQISVMVHAQIGIGTSTPDGSAKLQIDASSKGFLPPRVALQGTDDAGKATPTIATPATGLLVYNTATAGSGATAVTPGIYYYSGSSWQRVVNQNNGELVVTSAAANTSGLKFTNLNSSTPTSGGATLGVDANGNVVTVNGSSFSPDFGTANPTGTINVAAGTSAELTRITITTTGTYLINYTMRVQAAVAAANQYAVGFLSLDNATAIVGTEILGAFPGGSTVAAPGGNYSGSHVITVNTVPTTIYFRAIAQNGAMGFLDDANGRTKISYVKVTP